MATITTRSGKGSPLTNTEVDDNFTNLNTDKIENVVEDTTPQLGGTLDCNGNTLVLNPSSDSDATIQFASTFDNIVIRNQNTAGLENGINIDTKDGVVQLRHVDVSGGIYHPMVRAIVDDSVELYYDNSKKLETTSTGIDVTGSVVSEIAINAQTGTTYTTVLADQCKLVTLTNASAITLTIPPNSSVAYPVGTKIDLAQLGAGQVTVAAGSGVTVNSTPTLKLRAQYSAASCIKTATDTWLLVGDLAES